MLIAEATDVAYGLDFVKTEISEPATEGAIQTADTGQIGQACPSSQP